MAGGVRAIIPRAMRRLIALLLFAGCTTATAPPPEPVEQPVQGLTLEEEASILRLEDRREFSPETVSAWTAHQNPRHRARIALALGRIGTASAPPELLSALTGLQSDPDIDVRRTTAFALGEIGNAAGIDALLVLARDQEHADVAAEAVEALSKMAAAVTLERYRDLTAPEQREAVRARAIRFLFRFDTDDASSVAAAALEDPNVLIRREGAYALSRRVYAPARAKLELLINDPDTLIRTYSARALGRIAAPESYSRLVAATTDPHPWVRTEVARAIGAIAAKTPDVVRHAAGDRDMLRIEALTEDADPGTRASAIDTLSYYATAYPVAREQLQTIAANGTRWQRELAVIALATRFGVEAVTSLIDDDSPGVHRGLLTTPNIPGSQVLRERWFDSSDFTVRASAIGAIPDEGTPRDVEAIRAALNDPDVGVRANAIDRLSVQKSIPAAERLALLLAAERRARNEAMPDARLSAIAALTAFDYTQLNDTEKAVLQADEDFTSLERYLRALVDDPNPMVRRAASDAMVNTLKLDRPAFTPLPIERPLAEYAQIAAWARQRHTATIHMPRGLIELVLLSQDAPMTAWNFATLAQRGYFDNTTFMRVVPNFVVQAGDPRNDQTGGPGYSIRDEVNLQKYTRGALGMALSGPDTGGSQHFITHSPQPHLDGGYTIFGRVIGGMGGVVDQIERGDRIETIRIDSQPAPEEPDFAAVELTPLPTELGETTPERLLEIVPEYRQRMEAYQPPAEVLEMLAAAIRPGDRIDVFLGTWCTDSQREMPRYLKILELLSRDYGVTLPTRYVAVNRGRTEPANLLEGRNIEKVSTFIVIRDGAEIGRIVETPEGPLEEHLLRIVSGPR
jgi:cyclophilin family peptidyl-prolyl cis-trans isomerase/HEAT repeat protein